jgi:transcriptional regulator with XRE-family HTH domain
MVASSLVTFADLLRHHRTAAGLTQEELAARAGLSGDAISTLERGVRRRPHNYTVVQLATALGLADEERAVFAATAHQSSAASWVATPLVDAAAATLGFAAVPVLPLPRQIVTLLLVDAEGSMRLPRRLRGGHGGPSGAA